MKKLFTLFLSLTLVFSLTACGGSETTTPTENNNSSTTESNLSAQDVIDAADQLRLELNNAAASNDFAAYSSLFVNTDEAIINNNFTNMYSMNEFDQHFTNYLGTDGKYHVVSHTDAIVSGVYPSHMTSRSNSLMILTKTADGWKYDLGTDAQNAYINIVVSKMHNEFQDAFTNGRNAVFFEFGNFTYLDSSCYVKNDFGATLTTLCQDAEGNVYAGIVFNNGTDGNRSATDIHLVVTDNSLGTVFDVYLEDTTVISGSNKYSVFCIPAGEIATGTSAWTSLNSNINHKNI